MTIDNICTDILQKFYNSDFENVITPKLAARAALKRESWVHKGSCGSLLVCGGSTGLTGAPCLSATSALRSGTGLVTLACADELNFIFEQKLTEVMTMPVVSKDGAIAFGALRSIFDKMQKCTALLIGPGLSVTEDIQKLVNCIIEESTIPLVLDADALNAVSKTPEVLKKAKVPVIITPHIGEFARLSSLTTDEILGNTESLAAEFSKEYGVVTVLKSHRTVVSSADGTIYKNLLGNPGMASAGTGDVLSGCIASFVSQGRDAVTSAIGGVYFHSFAADIAEKIVGEYSLIASDIINYLGYAIKFTNDNNLI